ncbi:acetyl-CoA C-acyltransferase [Sporosarcina ureilytica]|uniref:Acetyl-CoA acetyltransferase n=1 Tax=Sporosarcina ureilytica TaxID=298596 RepID=A0A1D8JK17_9BACL|nr:acetyl-CoA C-acyltransferase [Sporosarcina ureilytica]AOV09069.1 acetyl-CoA acetyltransferase [Sporosarcina ureilytica]
MFKDVPPHKLVAPLLQSLSTDIEGRINEVVLGNVVGPGGNIARLSALEAGLPLSIPGMTIDRQCSAGLEAIRTASLFIQGGAGDCYIAGGVESASTSPFPKRAQFAPTHLGDPDMGVGAENVAQKYSMTKAVQDDYALESYRRSWAAYDAGFYTEEIIACNGLIHDEVFRKKRDMARIVNRAKPIFDLGNGTVTAANSCGIHDGAAAVVVKEEQLANELGMQPILRFQDSEVSGIHPNYPGISPVPAITKLLARNQLTMADIDLIEINEAFASKIIACQDELTIPTEKLNVSGGALTTGHPYGASGAILVTRLFYEVQRRKDVRYVLAAIGSAGGVGLAVLFEVIQ